MPAISKRTRCIYLDSALILHIPPTAAVTAPHADIAGKEVIPIPAILS